jgi:hypothetical protein
VTDLDRQREQCQGEEIKHPKNIIENKIKRYTVVKIIERK